MPLVPKAGAQCGKSARWDLCGRPPARAVPTATGHVYRSALYPLLGRINAYLVRWIRNKYKRLRGSKTAHRKLQEITKRYPRIFAHWTWIPFAW